MHKMCLYPSMCVQRINAHLFLFFFYFFCQHHYLQTLASSFYMCALSTRTCKRAWLLLPCQPLRYSSVCTGKMRHMKNVNSPLRTVCCLFFFFWGQKHHISIMLMGNLENMVEPASYQVSAAWWRSSNVSEAFVFPTFAPISCKNYVSN